MRERLRIHHGVGSRVLLDSARDNVSFSYAPYDAGWRFLIPTDKTPEVLEVLRLKDEVNVFIFREEDGVAKEKVWFYTGNGQIRYDDGDNRLEVLATSNISYHPGDFEP